MKSRVQGAFLKQLVKRGREYGPHRFIFPARLHNLAPGDYFVLE
jgi:hypothetical protein